MQDIINSIKAHEGYEPMVYQCTEGHDTIGIGFKVADLKLSEKVCDLIMEEKLNDLILEEILDDLISRIERKLSWFRYAQDEVKLVIVNMSYQMGLSGVLKFKRALAAMEIKNWDLAATEMLDSLWAKQTSRRANELADLIRGL